MKNSANYKQFCFNVILLLALSVASSAQVSEKEAIELVRKSPCVESLSRNPRLIRLSRKEDIEDDLFALQVKREHNIVKDAYIFQVTNNGLFILSPDEYVAVISTGKKSLLFAVIEKTGSVYPLFGCPGAVQNFSALVNEVGIRINSESDARTFAVLYYESTKDPERERLIVNMRDFRHVVEDEFFGWFSDRVATLNFRRWTAIESHLNKLGTIGILGMKGGSEYEGFLTYVRGELGRSINLEKIHIRFDENGKLTQANRSTLISIKKASTHFQYTLGK